MKKFCLIGLVTLSLLLSACGGSSERRRSYSNSSFSSPSSSESNSSSSSSIIEPIELTIWTPLGHQATAELEKVVNKVVSNNEDIDYVKVITFGSYDNLQQRMEIAAMEEGLPDIFIYNLYKFYKEEDTPENYEQNQAYRRQFVAAYALPLEEEYRNWVNENCDPDIVSDVTFGGQTWGIPCTTFDYVDWNNDNVVIGESRCYLFVTNKKVEKTESVQRRYELSFLLAQQISQAYTLDF